MEIKWMTMNDFQNRSNTLLCNLGTLGERLEKIRKTEKTHPPSSTNQNFNHWPIWVKDWTKTKKQKRLVQPNRKQCFKHWPIKGGKDWKKSNKLKRIIWKVQPIWISSIDQLEKYKTEEHKTNQNESSTELNKSEHSDLEHGPIRTHVLNSEWYDREWKHLNMPCMDKYYTDSHWVVEEKDWKVWCFTIHYLAQIAQIYMQSDIHIYDLNQYIS